MNTSQSRSHHIMTIIPPFFLHPTLTSPLSAPAAGPAQPVWPHLWPPFLDSAAPQWPDSGAAAASPTQAPPWRSSGGSDAKEGGGGREKGGGKGKEMIL